MDGITDGFFVVFVGEGDKMSVVLYCIVLLKSIE